MAMAIVEARTAKTILIVEDDPTTIDFVRVYLARDGYEVLAARDGLEGLRLAREAKPDLVVLDLMLPRLDGMEVCRTLRRESDVPIVMLTARVEEEDRLSGLDIGADDYVVKPFSPRELVARVKAVLRRTALAASGNAPKSLSVDGVQVDLVSRSVQVRDNPVRLTPTEMRILYLLIREPHRTFSREEIINQVFDDTFDGFDRTVDSHVSNLRRKLEDAAGGQRYIRTVYGAGYRFTHA